MLPLIHYSAVPLDFATLHDCHQEVPHHFGKPHGLWFSVGDGDDGWRAWCEGEDFCVGSLVNCTEIILHDQANILRLSGVDDIDSFTEKYDCDMGAWAKGRKYAIDWHRVSEQYDGIIIAPYCYARRLDNGANWYYGWDCASGCIWKVAAIAEVRPYGKERSEPKAGHAEAPA
jgi:hypothetical protein